MSTPLTRRELRELERNGSTPQVYSDAEPQQPEPQPEPIADLSGELKTPLTRRQLREQGLLGSLPASEDSPAQVISQGFVATEPAKLEIPPRAIPTAPNSRRQMREMLTEASEPIEVEAERSISELVPLQTPEESSEELVFTGVNMLAEPTTQSIVLDVTSDAISLPVDTGELTITGSISIVSEPTTGSQPAGFDIDSELSSQDAVVGVVSSVNPISASDLIDLRAPIGVVPQSVLRRGWWKPWALALGALALAITAILSSITILGALGG